MCVVTPFILDVRFVDVPAGLTQEEGHTGCLHLFSREGFSRSFPSSTVKSNFVYQRFNRSRKNSSSGDNTEIRTHVLTSEGFEVTN